MHSIIILELAENFATDSSDSPRIVPTGFSALALASQEGSPRGKSGKEYFVLLDIIPAMREPMQ
ncbi:MAG: hypothetical protein Q8M11_04305 [Sulfuritalea sp.]|nr:hypothetical protein [Sulfuritalea sp.]MDP1982210.1 hypothetical protein [Sulfuritalea sp.]